MFNKKVRRQICSFLLAFMVLGSSLPVFAAKHNSLQKVKVGYFIAPGCEEGGEGEMKSGYAYEYLQRLAAYAGWEYEYVYGSFDESLSRLKSGEVDLMAYVSFSQERNSEMLFPNYHEGVAEHCILALEDDDQIVSEDSLSWKIIGALRGSQNYELLKDYKEKNKRNFKIIQYDTDEEMVRALRNGVVQAISSTTDDSTRARGVRLRKVVKLEEIPFYVAVAKNRADLLAVLNDAQQKMSDAQNGDIDQIYNRYLEANVAYQEAQLSKSTKDWLEKKKTITIGYLSGYRPLSDIDTKTGEFVGVFKDMMDDLSECYHIEYKAKAFSTYQDLLEALQNEEIDVIVPVYGAGWVAEEHNLIISSHVLSSTMRLISAEDIKQGDVKTLAVLKRGPFQEEYAKKYFTDAKLQYYDTEKECMKAVKHRQVDAALYLDVCFESDRLSGKYGLDDFKYIKLNHEEIEVGFGVKKGNLALLEVLDHEISRASSQIISNSLVENSQRDVDLTLREQLRQNASIIFIMLFCALVIVILIFVLFVRYSNQHRKELEKAREEAYAASQAKTDFLSRMSHDIRTPMNGIVGMTRIATENIGNPEKVQDALSKIAMASEQLNLLINDVLDMSRLESGTTSIAHEPFDVEFVLQTTISPITTLAKDYDVLVKDLEVDITHKHVLGSPIHMGRVVSNIMTNGVKYNKKNGEIAVSLKEEPLDDTHSMYEIVIRDTGIGMSEEFLTHAFEPFARENNDPRGEYRGTGLGLAITKELVELMGGTVSVESTMGIGSIFTVRFPFELDFEEHTNVQEEPTTSLQDISVLLVEDNVLNREIATFILEQYGAKVHSVENGKLALECFEQAAEDAFDLIIMDVQMPIMNGLEATRAIRALDKKNAKTIPIIAMTANAFVEDIKNCTDAGMNDHVSKPVDVDILLSKLSKYI